MTAGDLADCAIRETVELHDFFGQWLRPGGDPSLRVTRLEQALHADFRLIGPDGGVRERAAVIAWIVGARGSRGDQFRIEVSNMVPVWQSGEAVLLDYVEAQYGHGQATRRLSTALFLRASSAPCGVVWRHLQETWLQGDS